MNEEFSNGVVNTGLSTGVPTGGIGKGATCHPVPHFRDFYKRKKKKVKNENK
jgi:hypothetical protein